MASEESLRSNCVSQTAWDLGACGLVLWSNRLGSSMKDVFFVCFVFEARHQYVVKSLSNCVCMLPPG